MICSCVAEFEHDECIRGDNRSVFLLLLAASTSTMGTLGGGIGDIDVCSFGFLIGSLVSLKYLHSEKKTMQCIAFSCGYKNMIYN